MAERLGRQAHARTQRLKSCALELELCPVVFGLQRLSFKAIGEQGPLCSQESDWAWRMS